MHISKTLIRTIVALTIGACLIWPFLEPAKADADGTLPAVIQSGLALYASGGAEVAVSAWEKAGPLERDRKAEDFADEFRLLEKSVGHYRSFELIQTKDLCKTSKIHYVSMNFDRGAVFASFHVYKTSKDWVVQNMDFDTRPEMILPWLARTEVK